MTLFWVVLPNGTITGPYLFAEATRAYIAARATVDGARLVGVSTADWTDQMSGID